MLRTGAFNMEILTQHTVLGGLVTDPLTAVVFRGRPHGTWYPMYLQYVLVHSHHPMGLSRVPFGRDQFQLEGDSQWTWIEVVQIENRWANVSMTNGDTTAC